MFLIIALHILVCCLLILVVLLQSGKAGDLASTFGGAGSQTAFGTRSAATLLTKLTAISSAVFMVTCLILAGWAQRGESSVMENNPSTEVTSQKVLDSSDQKPHGEKEEGVVENEKTLPDTDRAPDGSEKGARDSN